MNTRTMTCTSTPEIKQKGQTFTSIVVKNYIWNQHEYWNGHTITFINIFLKLLDH